MKQQDCCNKIAEALRGLGVLPGHTIMVHASYKSLGFVPGGIETVIQGLLQSIGNDGTLLMPGFSWPSSPEEAFDVNSTPSNVGAIPEVFRKRAGTLRSIHPTHSICAVGRRAHELLDDHAHDCTPCGPHSPLRKMLESEGKIVMLGCGLRPNTCMHALEEWAEPPYLYGPNCVFSIRDHQGTVHQKQYRTFQMGSRGYGQRYDKVQELDCSTFLRRGQVLEAETFVLDAPKLKDAVLEKMKEDPCFFIEKRPD